MIRDVTITSGNILDRVKETACKLQQHHHQRSGLKTTDRHRRRRRRALLFCFVSSCSVSNRVESERAPTLAMKLNKTKKKSQRLENNRNNKILSNFIAPLSLDSIWKCFCKITIAFKAPIDPGFSLRKVLLHIVIEKCSCNV